MQPTLVLEEEEVVEGEQIVAEKGGDWQTLKVVLCQASAQGCHFTWPSLYVTQSQNTEAKIIAHRKPERCQSGFPGRKGTSRSPPSSPAPVLAARPP